MAVLNEKIVLLYDRDTAFAYKNLQELEALCENSNALYPYYNEFMTMLMNDKYVVRVRGFRLLCKLAKWDTENKLDREIDTVLRFVDDEKPTAVRQKLKALQNVVQHKKSLRSKIKKQIGAIDYFKFKDTMHSLIAKDIQAILEAIDA